MKTVKVSRLNVLTVISEYNDIYHALLGSFKHIATYCNCNCMLIIVKNIPPVIHCQGVPTIRITLFISIPP